MRGMSSFRRLASASAAMLSLAACITGTAADRWQRVDGSAPSMGEASDCHEQANRMAAARYPDPVLRNSDGSTFTFRRADPDRFAAEIRFYETCMRARGFSRGPSSPTPAPS